MPADLWGRLQFHTAQPGVIAWERGRPARILSMQTPPRPAPGRPHPARLNGVLRQGAPDRPEMPLVANQAIDAAGSDPVGGNRISQAEREQRRHSRLIEVGEIAEAVPGLVRAGRPRSQEVVIPLHPSFDVHPSDFLTSCGGHCTMEK